MLDQWSQRFSRVLDLPIIQRRHAGTQGLACKPDTVIPTDIVAAPVSLGLECDSLRLYLLRQNEGKQKHGTATHLPRRGIR